MSKPLKWSLISFGLLFISLIPSILTGYFAVVSQFPLAITIVILLIQLLMLTFFISLIQRDRLVGIKDFQLTSQDWKNIAVIFFFQWGVSFIAETIIRIIALNQPVEEDLFSSNITATPVLITFVSSVILSPLVEEYIFRGIILNKICQKNWTGVIVSGVLFGLAHVPTSFWSAIAYIGPGIILSYAYVKTNKLSYTITVHVLNNLLAFFLTSLF